MGGAEEPLVGVRVLLAPCSRVAKIDPPSSLATTIVRSGRGSSGPITSAGRRRAGTSRRPSRARLRLPFRRASEAPIAVETVPSMPDRPRLAIILRRLPTSYAGPSRSRSRIGFEAPTTRWPPGGRARLDGASDVVRREPGRVDQRVELARDRGVGVLPRRAARRGRRRRRRRVGRPGRRRTGRLQIGVARRRTSTSARASSRCTGRDSVGWPKTTTRSTSVGQRRWPGAAGRSAAPARCARRWTARPAAASPPRRPVGEPADRRRRRRPRPCGGRGRARSVPGVVETAAERPPHRPSGGGHPAVGRHQRVVELHVEVHEPGRGHGVERLGDVDGRRPAGRRSRPGRWSGWRRCRAAGPAGRR